MSCIVNGGGVVILETLVESWLIPKDTILGEGSAKASMYDPCVFLAKILMNEGYPMWIKSSDTMLDGREFLCSW